MTLSFIQRIQVSMAIAATIVAVFVVTSVNFVLIAGLKTENVPAPDFASFTRVQDKKQAFFSYLLPLIHQSNQRVISQRQQLNAIQSNLDTGTFSSRDENRLNTLAGEYYLEEDLGPEQKTEQLLKRIDVVPASLALAQAAKESGWGTSRFAREGNNYFGQWCYTEGCGLVPRNRIEGARHEVRKFKTTGAAVDSYFKNLNTHDAYETLREMRAEMRSQGKISGPALARGLGRYSERGQAYVDEILTIIRVNQLEQLDAIL